MFTPGEKKFSFIIVLWLLGFVFPLQGNTGYYQTDREGKIISDTPGNTPVSGSANQTIILNDRSNKKVFEVSWDGETNSVIIKGDNIHLKIHQNGLIEKWTRVEEDQKTGFPLIFSPIVPVSPSRPGAP